MSKILGSSSPEFYYKYRNLSPVSLKELLYGEIFFAERSELNCLASNNLNILKIN